jgi:hypothetical protein
MLWVMMRIGMATGTASGGEGAIETAGNFWEYQVSWPVHYRSVCVSEALEEDEEGLCMV